MKNKKIVAVIPKYHSGPGWANRTVTIYFQEKGGGEIEFKIYQYPEIPEEIRILFEIGAVINKQLIDAAERMFES